MTIYRQNTPIRVNSATTQSDLSIGVADSLPTVPAGASGVVLSYTGTSIVYVRFNSTTVDTGIALANSVGSGAVIPIEIQPGAVLHMNAAAASQTVHALWTYN